MRERQCGQWRHWQRTEVEPREPGFTFQLSHGLTGWAGLRQAPAFIKFWRGDYCYLPHKIEIIKHFLPDCNITTRSLSLGSTYASRLSFKVKGGRLNSQRYRRCKRVSCHCRFLNVTRYLTVPCVYCSQARRAIFPMMWNILSLQTWGRHKVYLPFCVLSLQLIIPCAQGWIFLWFPELLNTFSPTPLFQSAYNVIGLSSSQQKYFIACWSVSMHNSADPVINYKVLTWLASRLCKSKIVSYTSFSRLWGLSQSSIYFACPSLQAYSVWRQNMAFSVVVYRLWYFLPR